MDDVDLGLLSFVSECTQKVVVSKQEKSKINERRKKTLETLRSNLKCVVLKLRSECSVISGIWGIKLDFENLRPS